MIVLASLWYMHWAALCIASGPCYHSHCTICRWWWLKDWTSQVQPLIERIWTHMRRNMRGTFEKTQNNWDSSPYTGSEFQEEHHRTKQDEKIFHNFQLSKFNRKGQRWFCFYHDQHEIPQIHTLKGPSLHVKEGSRGSITSFWLFHLLHCFSSITWSYSYLCTFPLWHCLYLEFKGRGHSNHQELTCSHKANFFQTFLIKAYLKRV